MEVLLGISIVLLPLGLFAASLGLRVASDAQPETSWSGPKRRTLFSLSYLFMGIGMFVLLATVLLGRPIAVVPFVILLLAAMQFVEAEMQLIGSRRRAQEAELLWMLATAVASQRNLAEEVEAYARGTWGQRHERLLELAKRLKEGLPHSELAVPQGLLSRSVTLEIQAGFQSGNLAEALRDAAVKQTKSLSASGQASNASALVYPAAVLMTMVLILGFVMYYIIPKFKRIFDDFATELPGMTVTLIGISDAVVNYWYLLTPYFALVGGVVFVAAMAHVHGWQTVWQQFVGRWLIRPHTPDVLRSLAHSIARGVPLDRGLDPFVTSSGPILLQRRAAAVRLALSRGESCWLLLEREGFLHFREVVVIESAQRAGNLPWALEAIADNLDRRFQYRVTAFLELVRPIAILCLGVIVGFVAIAMFMPLVKLLNDLS